MDMEITKEELFSRTISLLGEENFQKLTDKTVAVIGLGGVGGSCFEAIVHSGVGKIVVVDKDVFDASNLNRQILCKIEYIKKSKALCAKKRAEEVNPFVEVKVFEERISKDNFERILCGCDFVFDCIDSVEDKADLIEYCIKNNLDVISSMGTGNRLESEMLKVCDITKTYSCPLARKMRWELKKRGVSHVMCVFSAEKNEKFTGSVPSMYFVPNSAGILMATFGIKSLIFK